MAEITTDNITTGSIEGSGVFDKLMSSIEVRLTREYNKNRIKGADYSKVYLGAMESAMQQSIAFSLGQQQADKQAELLVQQTLKAVEETDVATAQALKIDAETSLITQNEANALIQSTILDDEKLVSIEKAAAAPYEKDIVIEKADQAIAEGLAIDLAATKVQDEIEILIQQELKIKEDIKLVKEQTSKITSDIVLVKNQGYSELAKIRDAVAITGDVEALPNGGLVGKQMAKSDSEVNLLDQKKYTETAQTFSTIESVPVAGVVGAQTALLAKQKDGFDRDAEQKLAKIVADTYAVRRSTNKVEAVPYTLSDPAVDLIMRKAAAEIEVTIPPTPPA